MCSKMPMPRREALWQRDAPGQAQEEATGWNPRSEKRAALGLPVDLRQLLQPVVAAVLQRPLQESVE